MFLHSVVYTLLSDGRLYVISVAILQFLGGKSHAASLKKALTTSIFDI